jgi:branched-chain amino acid transport system substrate-binding protein
VGQDKVAFACLVALLTTSCSLSLHFNECNVDDDCDHRVDGGTRLFCTLDHLCVDGIPDDQLCKTNGVVNLYGSPDPNALVVAGILDRPTIRDLNSVTDYDMANALILGAEEINQIPNAQPVRLVLCDTGRSPEQTQRALRVAVQSYGAVGAVGPGTSDDLIGLANKGLVQQLHVVVVSPSATAVSLSGINPLIWRTAPSDALQAKVLATQVPASASKVEMAYANTTYGRGLNTTFIDAFVKGTPNTATFSSFFFATGSDMTVVANQLASGGPDVALLVADSDAPALVVALAGAGPSLQATQYLMTDSAKSPALYGPPGHYVTASVLDRIRGTGGANPPLSDPSSGPVFAAFRGRYLNRFPDADPGAQAWVGNTYDAFYAIVIAAATISDGRFSGERLSAGMAHLSTAGAPMIEVGSVGYPLAVTALQSGKDVNLVGSSGPIDFTAQHDVMTAPIEVWRIATGPTGPKFVTDHIVTP